METEEMQEHTKNSAPSGTRRRSPKSDLEETCRVYFIEAVGTDLVKIGYTLNVDARLRSLLTASAAPLRLLATIKGGPVMEGRYHIILAEHRSHGEWFRRCPLLNDLIATADKPKDAPEWLAKTRGAQLQSYLRKMQAGKVVRPTRGPAKRARRPSVDRYAWSL